MSDLDEYDSDEGGRGRGKRKRKSRSKAGKRKRRDVTSDDEEETALVPSKSELDKFMDATYDPEGKGDNRNECFMCMWNNGAYTKASKKAVDKINEEAYKHLFEGNVPHACIAAKEQYTILQAHIKNFATLGDVQDGALPDWNFSSIRYHYTVHDKSLRAITGKMILRINDILDASKECVVYENNRGHKVLNDKSTSQVIKLIPAFMKVCENMKKLKEL